MGLQTFVLVCSFYLDIFFPPELACIYTFIVSSSDNIHVYDAIFPNNEDDKYTNPMNWCFYNVTYTDDRVLSVNMTFNFEAVKLKQGL